MKKIILVILMVINMAVLSSCDIFKSVKKDDYQKIFDEIKIGYQSGDSQDSVTKGIILPLETTQEIEATISWASSHPFIIEANGTVKRPLKNTQVILSLNVTINNVTKESTIIVTVIGFNESSNGEGKVTISFNSNGGSLVGSITIKKGDKLTEPVSPKRDDYVFVEWQLDGLKFDFKTAVNSNILLVAIWSKDKLVEIPVIPNRVLTFQDEFDGTSIDKTKWVFQNGTGKEYGLDFWGNQEKQYYQENNAIVKDGILSLNAKQEEVYDEAARTTMMYTSSKLVTLGKFSQTYGRFEARIKAPLGNGFWPAFWLMPVNNTYGNGWPYNGEIDIMEMRGREVNNTSSAIHFQSINNHHQYLTNKIAIPDGGRIDEFHIYALEWSPGRLEFSVDNYVFYVVQTSQFGGWYKNTGAPFDHDFYIILNLAIGGHFDNHLLPSTKDFPAKLEIDFVRVYEKLK